MHRIIATNNAPSINARDGSHIPLADTRRVVTGWFVDDLTVHKHRGRTSAIDIYCTQFLSIITLSAHRQLCGGWHKPALMQPINRANSVNSCMSAPSWMSSSPSTENSSNLSEKSCRQSSATSDQCVRTQTLNAKCHGTDCWSVCAVDRFALQARVYLPSASYPTPVRGALM